MTNQWKHPTGQVPSTIFIVCAGYTMRQWHAVRGCYRSPIDKHEHEYTEVWSLNKALRTNIADFGFVMDDLIGEYRRDPIYIDQINRLNIPILTSTVDDPVIDMLHQLPSNARELTADFHEYPILPLRDSLGDDFTLVYLGVDTTDQQARLFGNQMLYLKNSFPMMLAYAYLIGVKTIYVFGADYTHPQGQARESDQPNAEYWVGYLRGRGIQVVICDDSTLLDTRDGRAIYGYGARQPAL